MNTQDQGASPSTSPVTVLTTGPQPARPKPSWFRGRGELSVGILALLGAGLLTLGTITMQVRGQQEPGPQFFPIIVICLLALSGGWVTIQALLPRKEEQPDVWHRPDISEDMLADLSGTNTEVINLEARHQESSGSAGAIDPNAKTGFDWRTFGLVLGAVVAFAVLLEPVGWILSAAMLFWLISYALGSKRPIFDIGVALIMSSLVQIAFSAGLGLALPAGFIGWIF